MSTNLSDYNYHLPDELIAKRPLEPRDSSKLLVYKRESGEIIDSNFRHINSFLVENTTLVTNKSKVEKVRLIFGEREIFVTKTVNNKTVEAMVYPGKDFRRGVDIGLGEGLRAYVEDVLDSGLRRITFNKSLDDRLFDSFRHTPFPPYVDNDEALSERYQTVYAQDEGSQAAPTAGLHFTPELLEIIRRTHNIAEVTLHVGLGTFAPVKTDNIDDHSLHSEWYEVSAEAAQTLNAAQHITAVGTTSVRVLESAYQSEGYQENNQWTDIFIKPGFEFTRTDSLITNFHLPKSSLLMLVAAFMGLDEMHRVYKHAIDNQYRFYSFGDAMLIL